MNSKIEKLLNEQSKNNTRIEDYKERITALQDSIKKLNARNREIDAEIVAKSVVMDLSIRCRKCEI